MQKENVIEVRDLKKQFRVYRDKGSSLKEKILFKKRNAYEKRVVLDGISFDVKKGEAIGLIGKNGSGKSTTLKLLTKIMYPDEGIINIRGRVSSLIELGAGFHPDMSGRENIFINASIFGLTKKEILEKLDDIISFSELGDYIDSPVRTYSSGMYMRLAFSVAINVNAEVLLVDEILSVGDSKFQKKCLEKMKEIKKSGTTIVIVSHILPQIEEFCDRSIWINNGKIEYEGKPEKVHEKYLAFMNGTFDPDNKEVPVQMDIEKESCIMIDQILIMGSENVEKGIFKIGETMTIYVHYKAKKSFEGNVEVAILCRDGSYCTCIQYEKEAGKKFWFEQEGDFKLSFFDLSFLDDKYIIKVTLYDEAGIEAHYNNSFSFKMQSGLETKGCMHVKHEWN